MNRGPLPKFTIEELLREAVEAVPADERCVFTTRELARLWGYSSLDSARKQMNYLQARGWKFIATRKEFINRAKALTSTSAYIVVPPGGAMDAKSANQGDS